MNFIAAVDQNWNIGRDGALLQPISADLKQFKEKTWKRVVVLGRKTLKTFPGGKPLEGRTNIILSRQQDFSVEGGIVCHSITELFSLLSSYRDEDIFVVGGGEIYNKLIPYCKTGLITKIHKSYPADTSIINLDAEQNWRIVKQEGPFHFKEDIYYSYLEYYNSEVVTML